MPTRTLELVDPSLVVLVGPAGCGKSTFADRCFDTDEVLSSDACRALVSGDPGDQSATADAFGLLRRILDARMKRRRLTVVDATNLTHRERARLLGVAARYDVPAVAVVFSLPLVRCQELARGRVDRPVDEEVVARQYATFRRHLPALADEGFGDVVVLTEADLGDVEVRRRPEPGPATAGALPGDAPPGDARGRLPPAVIVDLDGTLTSAAWREHHLTGRRKDWPAFFAGMTRDAPVGALVDLVGWIADHASVILLTGRPDDHEVAVRRWLADHRVAYDRLLMRASGDRRPDTVVKRERYRREVAPGHDVRLVIDDRPSVVEMWREEGLYVLTAVDPHLEPLPKLPPSG